jgi:F0F1-type ATP synthase membrane subunit c/vacuolar-type H+-ATPase subunit K
MMNQSSPTLNQPSQPSAGSRFRGLMIIWGLQLLSLAFLSVPALALGATARAETNQIMLAAFAAAGLACVGVSFIVKASFVARGAVLQRPDLVTNGYVIAFVLCEACALLGLVLRFLMGARDGFYFFGAAALGFLLNVPRRRHVEDASGGRGETFKTTL